MKHVTLTLSPNFSRKFILACPALKALRLGGHASATASSLDIPRARRPVLQSLRTEVNSLSLAFDPNSFPFDLSQLVSFGIYGTLLTSHSWLESVLGAAPNIQELGYHPNGYNADHPSEAVLLRVSQMKRLGTIVLFAENNSETKALNNFLFACEPPSSLKMLSIICDSPWDKALVKIDERLSSRPWINVPNITLVFCQFVSAINEQCVSQAFLRTLSQRKVIIQWKASQLVVNVFWE
ncbi:hypothetical protein DL96DRAFT_1615245 [Flagelloscypha sp. PMI_526]|nr:hypothetical protein DL96DRAFT_1615245 [Flagelloscypha sp. PMI_526]